MSTFPKVCTGLSASGILFLLVIGRLFQTQPLYVSPEVAGRGEADAAARACYSGAGAYAFFLVASLAALCWRKLTASRRARAVGGEEGLWRRPLFAEEAAPLAA
ncbi:unnamed protein product, partial [Phaeothamnion confervicola]